MQTSSGAAITVAQLAASNLSNGTTGSGAVVLADGPTFVTTNPTFPSQTGSGAIVLATEPNLVGPVGINTSSPVASLAVTATLFGSNANDGIWLYGNNSAYGPSLAIENQYTSSKLLFVSSGAGNSGGAGNFEWDMNTLSGFFVTAIINGTNGEWTFIYDAFSPSFVSTSDSRLKTVTGKVENVLDSIDTIQAVKFQWNDQYTKANRHDNPKTPKADNPVQIGLLAQEVQKAFPESVKEWKGGDEQQYLGMDYGRLVSILFQGIKELRAELNVTKAELALLKTKVG